MTQTEKEKMLSGALYSPADPELQNDMALNQAWLKAYNATLGDSEDERRRLLASRLAHVGLRTVLRPPFYCDYGYNITLGADVFLNYNCVILDICAVSIGDGTQIGPAVQIYSADHPRDAAQRRAWLEFGRPVHIGSHVWIGGGAIILPGITIGDEAIIGAGAVVTRDVPSGATVVGNPARVIPHRGQSS